MRPVFEPHVQLGWTLEDLKRKRDGISKEYKNALREEPIPEPPVSQQTQTSEVFRSLHIAYAYYQSQGYDFAAVDQKIRAEEIRIGYHPTLRIVGWNDEGRAIIETPVMKAARDDRERLRELRSKLGQRLRDTERAVLLWTRGQSAKLVTAKCAFKRDVEEWVKKIRTHRWTLALPYCCFGRPIYSEADFEKEYAKQGNRHAVRLIFKELDFTIYRLRNLLNAEGTCWGMRDAASSTVVVETKTGKLAGYWDCVQAEKKTLLEIILGT